MKGEAPSPMLQRLHEAAERISANLVELELDSSRQLLEASPLVGESAARWSAASTALTELWRRHGLLEHLLQRADKLHGSRRANELGAMLDAPSIELDSSDVPLAERSLLGSVQTADRCTADQLLASMSSAFDEVKTVISRIGEAWNTLIPKLDAERRLLQDTSRLAEELGESGRRDLKAAAQTLEGLRASVTTDPLSVPVSEVEALTRSLRAIREDLEGSIALKRGFEAKIHDAHELLEQVRATDREGQAAHEELLVKISVPGPPAAPKGRGDREAELAAIVALAQRGAWREARSGLDNWSTRTNASLDLARRTLDANRAPIEARNQFRALLDAYQVKAKRLGLVEEPQLAEIFTQAQQALYNAPTDLALAAQLVRSYQQALSGSHTPEALP
jgi:hypothetical protein